MTDTVGNIIRSYRHASREDWQAGSLWYPHARLEAAIVGAMAGSGVVTGAAVIAAASPRKQWSENLRIARECAHLGYGKGQTATQNDKITQLLNEEPSISRCVEILGGRAFKTASFLFNILGCQYSVTIDRHAVSVAEGRFISAETTRLDKKSEYERYENAYRAAARVLAVEPAILQATVWTYWKRTQGDRLR